PDLLRSLRRTLPQPRPRGPQHDVRLGDRPVTIGTARSLSLEAGARPIASPEMLDQAAVLSRREATLRAAAPTRLGGIALVPAIGLTYLLAQGTQLAVLSMATMAVCVGLGLSLAAASAGAARQLWRAVAGAGLLGIAGWGVPP